MTHHTKQGLRAFEAGHVVEALRQWKLGLAAYEPAFVDPRQITAFVRARSAELAGRPELPAALDRATRGDDEAWFEAICWTLVALRAWVVGFCPAEQLTEVVAQDRRHLTARPDDFRVRAQLGLRLALGGRLDEALTELRQAVVDKTAAFHHAFPHDGWLEAIEGLVRASADDTLPPPDVVAIGARPEPTRQAAFAEVHALSADLAARWAESGMSTSQAAPWIAANIGPEQARVWKQRQVDPDEAARRTARGQAPPPRRQSTQRTPARPVSMANAPAVATVPLGPWQEAGFTAGQANDWRHYGFALSEAIALAGRGLTASQVVVRDRYGTLDSEIPSGDCATLFFGVPLPNPPTWLSQDVERWRVHYRACCTHDEQPEAVAAYFGRADAGPLRFFVGIPESMQVAALGQAVGLRTTVEAAWPSRIVSFCETVDLSVTVSPAWHLCATRWP